MLTHLPIKLISFTHITLPNNSSTNIIGNNLNKLGIKTVPLSSKTICDLLYSSPRRNIVSDAGGYYIPCKNCKLKYICGTSMYIHKRLYEYRREISIGNLNSALLQHILKSDHNFDCNAVTMLAYIHNKSETNFWSRRNFTLSVNQ